MTTLQSAAAFQAAIDRDDWTQCWLDDPEGVETAACYAAIRDAGIRLASTELHRVAKLRLGVDRSTWTLCVIDACRLGTVGLKRGRFILQPTRRPARLEIDPALGAAQLGDRWAVALQYWIDRSGHVPAQGGPLIDGRQYTCKRALLELRRVVAEAHEATPPPLPVAFARAAASGLLTTREAQKP